MKDNKANIAVFISGGGTNLQSLIDASKSGRLAATIALVVSNKPDAYGLTRATNAGIDTYVFKQSKHEPPEPKTRELLDQLENHAIDYIALAGYLRLLPPELVDKYRRHIINIHPGPLPKYGGKGMYGHRVHQAVLDNKETETCATVHIVDEIYDHGLVLETSPVPVKPDDTADTLAARVLEAEHELYPRVLDKLIRGEYDIDD